MPVSKEKLPFQIKAPIEPYFSSMDEVESEHWFPPVDESSDESSSDDNYPAQDEAESKEISAVEEKQSEDQQPPVKEDEPEALLPEVAQPAEAQPAEQSPAEDLFPPLKQPEPEAVQPAVRLKSSDLFPPLREEEPGALPPAVESSTEDLFPPAADSSADDLLDLFPPLKQPEPEAAKPAVMMPINQDLFSFVKDVQLESISVTKPITQDLFKPVQELQPETMLPVVEAPAEDLFPLMKETPSEKQSKVSALIEEPPRESEEPASQLDYDSILAFVEQEMGEMEKQSSFKAEESILQKPVLDEIKDSARNQIEDKSDDKTDSGDKKECNGGDDMISGISEIGNRSDNLDVLNGKLREIQEREARLEEKTAILGMHMEALKTTLENYVHTRETSDSQLAQSIELLRQEMTKISGSLLVNNVPKMDMLMKHLSHVFKYVQYLSKEFNELRTVSGKTIQKPAISEDEVKQG